MENPLSWPEPVRIIAEIISQCLLEVAGLDPQDIPIGYSTPMRIYLALKEKGFINDGPVA